MANIPTKRGVPGVYLIENDLSQVVSPSIALNVGVLISSRIGECETIISLGNETTFKQYFGEPTDINYDEWFNATRIFKYKVAGLGATLKTIRVVGENSTNTALSIKSDAVATTTTNQLIKNKDEIDIVTVTFDEGSTLKLFSRYPTDVVYKVAIANVSDFATADIKSGVSFKDNFDDVPEGTEIALAILDANDNILEKFVVDLTKGNVDGFNQDTYIENVINEKSKYLFAFHDETTGTTVPSLEATPMVAGTYNAPVKGDYVNALKLFENIDNVDINYIVANPQVHEETMTLCSVRKDCTYRAGIPISLILGVDETTATSNAVNYTTVTLNTNNTYGSMNANALLIYDEYAKKNRWINCAGDMVGLRVRQNLSAEPWFSDGGLNYGQLVDVKRFAQNWSPTAQKELIKAKMNPLISKPGRGKVKIEQHTYTAKNSALRDENVRELLVYIWRASRVFLEWKLHEFNDEFTRADVESQMNRFLGNIQDGRGIRRTESGGDGYRVRCDSTNNTDDVINQNMLVIDIAFLPARVITEIFLRVNIMGNSVQLEMF